MNQTLYRRPLPSDAVEFSSKAGRELFADALASGGLDERIRAAAIFGHRRAWPCGDDRGAVDGTSSSSHASDSSHAHQHNAPRCDRRRSRCRSQARLVLACRTRGGCRACRGGDTSLDRDLGATGVGRCDEIARLTQTEQDEPLAAEIANLRDQLAALWTITSETSLREG